MHNVIDLLRQAPVDTTPPTVTSKTPAAGATGVALASNITAQFSEAVTGVSSTSFTLTSQGGSPLAATVTYDSATNTATLNPSADLTANTSYTAQLSSAITDAVGNALTAVSWSFTSGAAGGSTTVSFGADADTYVSQASPTSSYATSSSFSIVGGSGSAKQAFLRFTVSGLPAGASISSAKLRLYVTNDSTSGGIFNSITSNSWAESITWNSKPAIDGPQLAKLLAHTGVLQVADGRFAGSQVCKLEGCSLCSDVCDAEPSNLQTFEPSNGCGCRFASYSLRRVEFDAEPSYSTHNVQPANLRTF